MVLFGFEGDEIQIRLTPLHRNLMSRADSGNLFTLQTAAACSHSGAEQPPPLPFTLQLSYLPSFPL